MALETLKGVTEIGGFPVLHANTNDNPPANAAELREGFYGGSFIQIDHHYNMIQFKMQMGTVPEAGINGCQVDTLIETALIIVAGLNVKLPCDENYKAITYLEKALKALKRRTIDRKIRGVEGTSNA